MSSYVGRHAGLYDLFYAAKPYAAEVDFILECFKKHSRRKVRRILELACGTGSHALEFHKNGFEVTATDNSGDMLSIAREKAAQANASIAFHEIDMQLLDPLGQPFDSVICLFDSIGYVQSDSAIRQVLRGVHANLCHDGLFVFEFWHAPAMLNGFDPLRVRRFPTSDGEVLRISETTLQRGKSLAEVRYSIYDLRNDRTYDQITETQTNRYFTVAEMTQFAADAGFSSEAFYAGYSPSLSITSDTWHVLAVWRRLPA